MKGIMMRFNRNPDQKVRIAIQLVIAVVLLMSGPDCRAQPKKASGINPDAKIQELIRKFINSQENVYKPGLDEARKLDELARKTPEVLAPQLVYFSANRKTEIEWVGESAMMMVLQSDTELRAPIIPLLETDDTAIQKAAMYWLTFFRSQRQEDRPHAIQRCVAKKQRIAATWPCRILVSIVTWQSLDFVWPYQFKSIQCAATAISLGGPSCNHRGLATRQELPAKRRSRNGPQRA
jgi:hypothetical protein